MAPELGGRDPEDKNGLSFVYLSLPHNTGYASAQSIAYQLSTAVSSLPIKTQDDVSHPDRLQNSSRFFFPTQTTACGHQLCSLSNRYHQKRRSLVRPLRVWERIKESYLNGGHVICLGTLLFKRKVFERVGGLTSFLKEQKTTNGSPAILNQGFTQIISENSSLLRSHPDQLSRLVKGIGKSSVLGIRTYRISLPDPSQ